MGQVILYSGITRLDLPIEQVLDMAKDNLNGGVIILGYDKSGEYYFASSFADGGEVLLLLQSAIKMLLEQ
jgi:basic membrane lipoprotein Med (substrate-binding protein (PBP1-ABC) superfamily)